MMYVALGREMVLEYRVRCRSSCAQIKRNEEEMNLQHDQNSSEHDGQDNHNHRIRMRPFPLPYPPLPTTIYVVIARRGQLHRHLD